MEYINGFRVVNEGYGVWSAYRGGMWCTSGTRSDVFKYIALFGEWVE